MYLAFMILLNKIITRFLKIIGKNGSVYPGLIIYDYLDKNILTKIKYPKYVIAVSGSSGKGSTTDLIAKILKANNLRVIYNQSGSNAILGALTLILNNCNLKGQFKGDVLLLETDERHLKLIFPKGYPTHLVLTNITRDQPARNGHPELVFAEIKEAIYANTKLIINADDPLINTLASHQKVVTYGIAQTKDSYQKPDLDAVDFAYCPYCQTKLSYQYYHYGHLGNYHCPKCDFKRDPLTYEATAVDLKNKTMLIANHKIRLNKDALYMAYATLAAYALTRDLGVPEEIIVNTLNHNFEEAKRGQELTYHNRAFIMLESKNENNLSYYQSLKYISNYSGHKSVIVGFENVSRRYSYNDLSWLYDVNFELLADPLIDKIFCIGRFRYDVATRLAYAHIDATKIVLVPEIKELFTLIDQKSKGPIFSIVCFDSVICRNCSSLDSDDNTGCVTECAPIFAILLL